MAEKSVAVQVDTLRFDWPVPSHILVSETEWAQLEKTVIARTIYLRRSVSRDDLELTFEDPPLTTLHVSKLGMYLDDDTPRSQNAVLAPQVRTLWQACVGAWINMALQPGQRVELLTDVQRSDGSIAHVPTSVDYKGPSTVRSDHVVLSLEYNVDGENINSSNDVIRSLAGGTPLVESHGPIFASAESSSVSVRFDTVTNPRTLQPAFTAIRVAATFTQGGLKYALHGGSYYTFRWSKREPKSQPVDFEPDLRLHEESAPSGAAYDVEPKLLSMENPQYPEGARRQGIQGVVLVHLRIGTDGRCQDLIILQSVPGLDRSAADAVRTSKWRPATRDRTPVPVWMAIPIEFKLPK